jgi:hypothetical protein
MTRLRFRHSGGCDVSTRLVVADELSPVGATVVEGTHHRTTWFGCARSESRSPTGVLLPPCAHTAGSGKACARAHARGAQKTAGRIQSAASRPFPERFTREDATVQLHTSFPEPPPGGARVPHRRGAQTLHPESSPAASRSRNDAPLRTARSRRTRTVEPNPSGFYRWFLPVGQSRPSRCVTF